MKKSPYPSGMRDDNNLPILIRQIRDGLLRQIDRRLETDSIDLNYSQYLVVKILAVSGPQMPGDLAKYLEHNAGAMTRLIDRLEDKGYVCRKPHAEDRRALTIELTASGHDLWRTISKCSEDVQEFALRDLKAADRAKVFELLCRVRDSLDHIQ
jgi:DNA-binding MarR family transcriptional regulator